MMRSFSNKSILFIAILLFLFIVTSIITLNPPKAQAANYGQSGLSEIKYMWLHSNGNIRAIDKYGNLAEFNYLTWTRLGNIGGAPWGYDPIGRNFYYFSGYYPYYTEAGLYNIDSETITKYPNLASLANSAYNSSCRIYNNRVYKLANITIQGTKCYPRLEEYDLNGNLLRQLDITDWQYRYEYESCMPFISGINTNNGTLVIREGRWGPGSYPVSWKVRVVNLSNLTVSYSGFINNRTDSPYWEYGIYKGSSNDYYTYQTVPGGKDIDWFTHYDYRLGICSYGIIASGKINSSVALYLNSTLISDKLSNVVSAYCRDKFGNHFVGCVDGSVYTLDYQGNPTQDSTFYSDYMTIDAVAEARLAKEAALTASSEAKQAKEKTNEAIDLINSLDTKFSAQLNIIQGQMQPVILSVKGRNGATATKGNTFAVDVTAANATYYRAGVNGNYTAWQSSPRIDNIFLPNSGVNTIEVQATNSLEEGAPVASGYITVFRL